MGWKSRQPGSALSVGSEEVVCVCGSGGGGGAVAFSVFLEREIE